MIVVSDAYPTVTAMAADIILPAAMWVEKEGVYGNAERRTHAWHQLVDAPGEAQCPRRRELAVGPEQQVRGVPHGLAVEG